MNIELYIYDTAVLFSEQRTFSGLRRNQLLEIAHDILSRELLALVPHGGERR